MLDLQFPVLVPIFGNLQKCALSMLFQTTIAVLVVVLDFDGSLCSPRDYGFPTIPAKIATGSASISIGKRMDQSQLQPMALGSGWFHSDHDMTSAHAEYLGLLLGLEYLNKTVATYLDEILHPWHLNNDNDDESSTLCLVIRGDCKVVIDQINGKSIPRKVQLLHGRVRELLGNLERKFGVIQAKHVSRNENTLCDGLCINLMHIIEWQAIQEFVGDFNAVAIRYGCFNTTTTMTTTRCRETSSLATIPMDQLSPSWLLARHFHSEATCHIKYSLRPPIYDAIACLSRAVGDTSTLIEVGERQAAESLIQNDKRMLAKGIYNQIEGWEGRKLIKKSLFLKRKHRVLLSNFGDIAFDPGMDVAEFSLLLSKEAPSERNDASDDDWKDLVQRMHKVAMPMDWKEGSKLWVLTTQSSISCK